MAGARRRTGPAGPRGRRYTPPRRAGARRRGAARARCGGTRRRAHARHARGSRAHPRLRVGDVLGALLRPLAGGPPALVLDGAMRQRGQGAPSPRALAGRPRVSSRYRWVILATGAVGAGAFSALRMGLPSLAPALRAEFGLSLGAVGLAFAAVTGGGMLTLVPWGALTDRIGERPVMASGLAGCAAALVGAALATSYAALLVALLVAGMFGSSATGASGRAVMGWFARGERGFALGIRQMALPLGGAVASLTLPSLIDARGLDAAFVALAGLSLTAAIASVVLMRDPPAVLGRRSESAPALP